MAKENVKIYNSKTGVEITLAGTITFPDLNLEVPKSFERINITLESTGDESSQISAGDQVDVTWDEGGNTNRAVRGNVSLSEDKKKLVIRDLRLKGKFKFQFWGVLEIGPANPDGRAPARVSVSIGNMFPGYDDDWILDFSAKRTPSDSGTEIKVSDLIKWIKDRSKGNIEQDPALPAKLSSEKERLNDLTIIFENFWFNITRRTFEISVATTGQLAFGDDDMFVLKDLGLILTNKPTEDDYKKLQLAPAASDNKKLAKKVLDPNKNKA